MPVVTGSALRLVYPVSVNVYRRKHRVSAAVSTSRLS